MQIEGKEMKVGAVIIATGTDIPNKEIERFLSDNHPNIFEESVLNYQRAGVKDIIVLVEEKKAKEIEDTLLHKGVSFLQVAESRIDSAVSAGLRYLQEQCDRILLGTIEYPFFSPDVINALTESGEDISMISHEGKKSGIFGLSKVGSQEICDQIERNSHQYLKQWDITPALIEVEEEAAVIQIKTAEEFQKYKNIYGKRKMHGFVKAGLAVNRSFLGPGVVTLLKQIDRLGSVRKACSHMGMSYSKGWKLIHIAVEETGWTLVKRTTGGLNGGEAHLTEQCKELIEKYERYTVRVQEAAKKIYDEIFENEEA